MGDFSTEHLESLVRHEKFPEAAQAINERYVLLSKEVLGVFEELLSALVGTSFPGDLQNLRGRLGLGKPSPRTSLREFAASQKAQNCLTAVLRSLEKSTPADVRMGLRKARNFFRKSDFYGTYGADIVNYEPEFSKLTDARLARLLSVAPNVIDMELLNREVREKKGEVLEAYRDESLEPVRKTFLEALVKCEDFFRILEEHGRHFRAFFDDFKKKGFFPDEDVYAEWLSLGDEYFHLELTKSSLMLPINPKAFYWGMQKDYPSTLERLSELKNMVTPHIEISEAERRDEEWTVGILCRNPSSLKKEGLTIEPSFRFVTADLDGENSFSCRMVPVEKDCRYAFFIRGARDCGIPFTLTLRIICEATYYSAPFVSERAVNLNC